jgi:hypothetical protein
MNTSEIKRGSKINSWLVDTNYLENESGISKNDMEHFKKVCDYIYTKYFVTCPVPLFISWDRPNKRFYFSVGDKFCLLPYRNDISEYDYSELLERWSYRFYPGYEIEEEYERVPTSEEIANFVLEGVDPDDAFNRIVIEKKKEKCTVEKIVVKEDQITININNKRFIALSRPDKPISEFIAGFRKIDDPYLKKAFLKEYTKNILEVTFLKNIDVKIESKFIENFFKIRVANNFKYPLIPQDEEGYVYKWGRFTMFFAKREELNIAKKVIKYYKENFENADNIDAYLKREFNMIFGVKDVKIRKDVK